MLKLLFKSTAYYVIWQKFKKQIVLVLCSIILISLIGLIYEDLFQVFKVNNRDSVGVLLFFKWFFIVLIIGYNIHVLRKTKIDSKTVEKKEKTEKIKIKKDYSSREKEVLKKRGILSTSDLILKKYESNQ